MRFILVGVAIFFTAALSLLFSTLTYSLRSFSRARLAEAFEEAHVTRWLDPTIDQASDLIFVTALGRLVVNIFAFIAILHGVRGTGWNEWIEYAVSFVLTSILTLFTSIAIPHAIADHAAERFLAALVRPLHAYRRAVRPVTGLMHSVDRLVREIAGHSDATPPEQREQQFEDEILSAVKEGEKEGVVDEAEREMIESVIDFSDTTAGHAMTTRPDIVGLDQESDLETVKRVIRESNVSRIPVYERTLDRIVGILYARDLLQYIGSAGPMKFDLRTTMRPVHFVPESKPLRDVLQDFRDHKVHIAIVLDEYGGTAGLITIEDIIEELVGDITDEHDSKEPDMLRRVDAHAVEADARIDLDELNRQLKLDLPEDEGYDTLGGFVSTTLGRIPAKDATFNVGDVRFTVTEAEPQRVLKVRIDLPTPT